MSFQISRVNPGSKAAEKVREGDLISSINGKEADNLTNQVNIIDIIIMINNIVSHE